MNRCQLNKSKPDKSKCLTSVPRQLEQFFIRSMDLIFEKCPRPFPPKEKLRQCKIISHRGIHDNRSVLENTMEAIEGVKRAKIWGVEIDVRWTKDLVPIVIHDRTMERFFDWPVRVSERKFSEIRNRFPVIPSLKEVVDNYGKHLHLMVEIKEEPYPEPVCQNRVLKDIFKELEPGKHFHLISLTPQMLDVIRFVSGKICLLVATTNTGVFSRLALSRGYGGINGHYLLVTNGMILRHHEKNQKVGTGFIESVNCLFRELNRGVDWVYSNDAARLQAQVDAILKVSK